MADDDLNSNSNEKTYAKCKVDIEGPSKELLEWARNHINENPDVKDLLLSELKDRIYEKGECVPSRLDDEFLLRFLRARDFCVQKAHRLYVNYHHFKEDVPDYFYNVSLDKLYNISKTGIFTVPPNRDQLGRRLLLIKFGKWVPSDYTPTELIQFVVFLTQISLLEPETQIRGAVLVIDVSGITLEMVWYMTPKLAKHLVNLSVTAYPLRLEAVHFVNTTWMFDTAFAMVKVLISEFVRRRVHFHNDWEGLRDSVDVKGLGEGAGESLERWFKEAVVGNEAVMGELERCGYGLREFVARRKVEMGIGG
ncbi:unnamed protein product [Phyllotreta striolata]|uniref:CRAL-TRIO domain-containing protein n=1 Tax=Phyllotreta striolata TaxID=444603 RepID=A0A9N9TXT1_PHYSR|nr:unnamed protein product [Phyllotreta striolata]